MIHLRQRGSLLSLLVLLTGSLWLVQGCSREDSPLPLFLYERELSRLFLFTHPEEDASPLRREAPLTAILERVRDARQRIEIWCYGLDEPSLILTLQQARERGVEIRIVGSQDRSYPELEEAGFSVELRARTGLQHSKVMLVDRHWLISGTGNFTTSGLFYNHNLFFHLPLSPSAADSLARSLDHETDPTPPITLPLGGRALLSPSRGRLIQSLLVQAILSARHSIRYLIFSHTDPVITDALLWKANQGVIVEGIYDDPYHTRLLREDTEGGRLNNRLGITLSRIYTEGNESRYRKNRDELHGGHLHHKTLLIDHSLVLTGSYNWSLSARDSNLELLFRFENPALARLFHREFERIRKRAHPQARPPFPPLAFPLHLTPESPLSLALSPPPIVPDRITLFTGEGVCFRALHFSLPPGTRRITPAEILPHSAGLIHSSSHPLAVERSFEEPARYQTLLSGFRSSSVEPSSPEQIPCRNLALSSHQEGDRVSLEQGWLWFPGETEYVNAGVWERGGYHASLPLTHLGAGYYTLSPLPSPGDAILFLYSPGGGFRTRCLQSGTSLSGPPLQWIHALEWETGKTLRCTQLER